MCPIRIPSGLLLYPDFDILLRNKVSLKEEFDFNSRQDPKIHVVYSSLNHNTSKSGYLKSL
jgi:hypothetical protein